MTAFAVIGNISRDTVRHPGTPDRELLGGAALHIARAAAHAGLRSTPVAVIGHDLRALSADPRLNDLDLSAVAIEPGVSSRFTLIYDEHGQLLDVQSEANVAELLTDHALAWIAEHTAAHWHACCRTPLHVEPVLDALVARGQSFSTDFFSSSAPDLIPAAAPFLLDAEAVFVNATEHEILARHAPTGELRALIVTDGPRPALLYRHGRLAARTVPPATAPVEVTGAGDTLAGTLLAAWAAGLSDHDALRQAVAAATAHTAGPVLAQHP